MNINRDIDLTRAIFAVFKDDLAEAVNRLKAQPTQQNAQDLERARELMSQAIDYLNTSLAEEPETRRQRISERIVEKLQAFAKKEVANIQKGAANHA